ncbi:MAG: DUF1269 domain-containing protein [Proteobacteria bacterium]|nr:DUF1269 domain-containing protein [Pseudomonadota bacterium]
MSNPATLPVPPGSHIVMSLFATHGAADGAVRKLDAGGVPLASISVVGRNYHSEEQPVGYFNAGERAWFYGKLGAFWGGLAGLLLGSGFFFVPVIGPMVVLGPMTSVIVGGIEGAVLAGGASALVGALTGLGVPRNSVLRYDSATRADQFLVTVHAQEQDVQRIQQLLAEAGGSDIETHALT